MVANVYLRSLEAVSIQVEKRGLPSKAFIKTEDV